ncbi:MAG: hypothetical protein JSR97_04800 [Verrucomicrobia bacterium]|nr:hypothetical protein [Verrucomicrobiota bacterium]
MAVNTLRGCCGAVFNRQTGIKMAKGLGVVALAALTTFGILGLLQTQGHLSLPHSFSWLSTALDKVGHNAAFGSMIGVSTVALIGLFGRKAIGESYKTWKDVRLCRESRKLADSIRKDENPVNYGSPRDNE